QLPYANVPGYTTVRKVLDVDSSVHAAIENALDVPHTAFLHKGLFRGSGEPNTIEVVVRRWADRAEAEFIGEPRPEGLAGRLLSPSGGIVTHFDRFIMPSIAQVEYRLGEENHIVVTSNWTPMRDFKTRMFAAISFRLRLPGWMVQPLVQPIVSRIFAQDATILKLQTDAIHRFGGERFVSTEIDVLGPHIWRLMTQAERGNLPGPDAEPFVKKVTLRV
ncbi:MAG: aromatic ring-hydroxylating dioxygenase subunit alpha, partial [Myxococcota bacterium]